MELKNEFRVDVPVDDAFVILTNIERIAPCMPGAQLQEIEGDEYRGIVKVKVGPITAQYKGAARMLELDKDAHRAVMRAEGRETRGQGNANATITAELQPDGDGTRVSVVTDLTVTGRVAQFGRGVMADVSTKLLGQFVDCLEQEVLSGATPAAAADAGDNGDQPAQADKAEKATNATKATKATKAAKAAKKAPATESTTETPTADVAKAPAGATAGAAVESVPAESPAGVRKVDSREAEPVDLLETVGKPVAKRAVPVVLGAVALVWLIRLFVKRRKRG